MLHSLTQHTAEERPFLCFVLSQCLMNPRLDSDSLGTHIVLEGGKQLPFKGLESATHQHLLIPEPVWLAASPTPQSFWLDLVISQLLASA